MSYVGARQSVVSTSRTELRVHNRDDDDDEQFAILPLVGFIPWRLFLCTLGVQQVLPSYVKHW